MLSYNFAKLVDNPIDMRWGHILMAGNLEQLQSVALAQWTIAEGKLFPSSNRHTSTF